MQITREMYRVQHATVTYTYIASFAYYVRETLDLGQIYPHFLRT